MIDPAQKDLNQFFNENIQPHTPKRTISHKQSKATKPPSRITEVFESNFVSELKRLSTYLENYPYIGMDTEFPGTVYPCSSLTQDFYYQYIKTNVDKLKLIQVGITWFNEKGETAPEGSTWQFNWNFNIEKDKYSSESITMLSNCGLDFIRIKRKGIHHYLFAEYFMISGWVLNSDIHWISFNGFTDFAYLLKLCLNSTLPETEQDFLNCLQLYFPNHYDIKILAMVNENLKGGLNKLAQQLKVERIGEMHQAGSDSIVTGDVYFKWIENNFWTLNEIYSKTNILFGIGWGADDNETIMYTTFSKNVTNSISSRSNNSTPGNDFLSSVKSMDAVQSSNFTMNMNNNTFPINSMVFEDSSHFSNYLQDTNSPYFYGGNTRINPSINDTSSKKYPNPNGILMAYGN